MPALYNCSLTLPLPLMRICVNISTVNNDTLVAKWLKDIIAITISCEYKLNAKHM